MASRLINYYSKQNCYFLKFILDKWYSLDYNRLIKKKEVQTNVQLNPNS